MKRYLHRLLVVIGLVEAHDTSATRAMKEHNLFQRPKDHHEPEPPGHDHHVEDVNDLAVRANQLRVWLMDQVNDRQHRLGQGPAGLPVMHTVADELQYCERLAEELHHLDECLAGRGQEVLDDQYFEIAKDVGYPPVAQSSRPLTPRAKVTDS
jgi:hypothetical protein